MNEKGISNSMTVLGLANGMIGGTILILPILGLSAGYLTSWLMCLFIGTISCYTAYLIILHLGKSPNIKECILAHFGQDYRYVKAYSFCMWFSFVPYFIIYFRLICLQLEGIIEYYNEMIGFAAAFLLIAEVILIQKFRIGEKTLAYGVVSIVAFMIFLSWAQITRPSGEKSVPAIGDILPVVSGLEMAFSIHFLIAQNIIHNKNRSDYIKIVVQTFIIATLSYIFITSGSFAIVNRQSFKNKPQTIEDYFSIGSWQIKVLQCLYLISLITSFPQFMLVSKIRFFQIFQTELQADKIKWQQICYIVFSVAIALLVFLSEVYLETIISINGAVISYIYVLLIPILIHFKCVYVDKSSGTVEGDQQHNNQISYNSCECSNSYRSKWTLYLQTFCLVLVLVLGIIMVAVTLINLLLK